MPFPNYEADFYGEDPMNGWIPWTGEIWDVPHRPHPSRGAQGFFSLTKSFVY